MLALAYTFRLRPIYRVTLALVMVSTALAIYGLEMIFLIGEGGVARSIRWKVLGLDARSRLEALEDLRRGGVRATLAVWPRLLLTASPSGFTVNGRRVFPLSGISDIVTVLCNETGEMAMYRSDEHGFNNPQGLHAPGDVDIAAVGDSMTQGFCVRPESNTIALLRNRYPKTLNLGMGGIGPLIQWAIFREYVVPLKPKVVLWNYTARTLGRVTDETNNPLLLNYLKREHSQELLSIQSELDSLLLRWVENRVASMRVERWLESLLLTRVRRKAEFILFLRPQWKQPEVQKKNEIMGEIMTMAKASVSSWGGNLYFVYLPRYHNIRRAGGFDYDAEVDAADHDSVLAIVRELQIPVIDLYPIFHTHSDPQSLFPFGKPGHYNEKGYKLVATTILQSIKVPERDIVAGLRAGDRKSKK